MSIRMFAHFLRTPSPPHPCGVTILSRSSLQSLCQVLTRACIPTRTSREGLIVGSIYLSTVMYLHTDCAVCCVGRPHSQVRPSGVTCVEVCGYIRRYALPGLLSSISKSFSFSSPGVEWYPAPLLPVRISVLPCTRETGVSGGYPIARPYLSFGRYGDLPIRRPPSERLRTTFNLCSRQWGLAQRQPIRLAVVRAVHSLNIYARAFIVNLLVRTRKTSHCKELQGICSAGDERLAGGVSA